MNQTSHRTDPAHHSDPIGLNDDLIKLNGGEEDGLNYLGWTEVGRVIYGAIFAR
jgi:hypothetical protein